MQRQALAGLLWSKQFYYYDVDQWLRGDPAGPPPPPERSRNQGWKHLSNFDIILMPDTWEYPWYAAWDLAFHCIAMALIDPGFRQEPAAVDAARALYASQWPVARLRMVL